MALDFPSSPTNGQVYDNYYWDAATGAWRSNGSKNGLSTRLAAVETANATTNLAGLVPVTPSSVNVGSGSASVGANGVVTLTGVSSISLNGVFSASYQHYRILINITGATGYSGHTLGYRYRNASDETTSIYYFGGQYCFANGTTGVLNSSDAGASYGKLFWLNNTMQYGGSSLDIQNPYTTKMKTAFWHGSGSHPSGALFNYGSGIAYSTTSYSGISFVSDGTGTFTGTMQVYGYR